MFGAVLPIVTLWLVWLLRRWKRRGTPAPERAVRAVAAVTFALYAGGVLIATRLMDPLLQRSISIRLPEPGPWIQLVPFESIMLYLDPRVPAWLAVRVLGGNLLLFVPLGLLLPIVARRLLGWRRLIEVALVASLGIETSQIVLGVGSFSVDDILLNTMGAVIGYATLRTAAMTPPGRWLVSGGGKRPTGGSPPGLRRARSGV